MTYRDLPELVQTGPANRSDADRLKLADQALALVQEEIDGLDFDGDDLAYLMEVLRLGVQRAMTATEETPVHVHAVTCGDSTH